MGTPIENSIEREDETNMKKSMHDEIAKVASTYMKKKAAFTEII